MKNNWVVTIIVIVIVAGIAFFGGMQYQKSQVSNFAQGQGAFRQRMMGQGQGQEQTAFRPVRGDILSVDNNTLTVKLSDGSSKIVILSGSTTYMKEASATKDDLKTGNTVMITGASNSDGSVTAQNVQINPTATRAMPSQGAQSPQQ
jgi:type II secretory pathway pseudopilin PulG